MVLPATTAHYARAIVMPNLATPIITTADAARYRQEIQSRIPQGQHFTPLMTLYLTEHSNAKDISEGVASGVVTAVKLYPAGATTHSDAGVKDLQSIYPILDVMQAQGIPLLVHGEVVENHIDIFDREAVFIGTKLIPMRKQFPQLKIVFEHITTKDGVDYVQSCDQYTAATITPHHLVLNRNDMLVGGIKPHNYCLPVAKREQHRLALREAAASGDAHFFLGTDSAPHLRKDKESACGCAGVFNAGNSLGIYAQVFEEEKALHKLEAFASLNGPAFYGLPVNEATIELQRSEEALAEPTELKSNLGPIQIFNPMTPIHWHCPG